MRTLGLARKLEIEAERVMREKEAQAATIATLQAEVERLREALKPFADVADFMDSETSGFADSDILHLVVKDESSERIAAEFFAWPVQLFRAARAALGASDA